MKQRHWIVDVAYNWEESACLDHRGAGFAYTAGEIAGFARTLKKKVDTSAVNAIALGAPSFKVGVPTEALIEALAVCERIIEAVKGSPWHAAQDDPPDGWHGPITGTRERLSRTIVNSRAKAGGYRTLNLTMHKDNTLWGRLAGRTAEIWFRDRKRFESAQNRHRSDIT